MVNAVVWRGSMTAAAVVLAVFGGGCENPVIVKGVENQPPPGGQVCIARGASGEFVSRSCLGLYPPRAVNVLFVVDHGPHALGLQTRLADAMPAFVDAIAQLNPPPYLRIGFTTSQDGNPACASGPGVAGRLWRASCREHPEDFVTPDGDRFADTCAPRCSLDHLDNSAELDPSDAPWLVIGPDADGTVDREHAAETLACNALLGASDCPFSAPLASAELAWARAMETGEAQYGFVRGDPTVMVIVSGGSECSITSAGVAAFDPDGDRSLWSDPEAEAATAATCFAAGNVCTAPDALASISCLPANIGLDGTPNEEEPVLDDLDGSRARFESFGAYLNQIFPDLPISVFVVAGVDEADPTTRPRFRAPTDAAVAAQLGVQPLCEIEGDPVVPASRLHAFAVGEEPPPADLLEIDIDSACAESWEPALERVADGIASKIRPMCVPACIRDMDEDTPGLQPECRFTADSPDGEGGLIQYELPRCEDTDVIPDDEDACWFPKTADQRHPRCAQEGYNLEMGLRWRGPVPGGTAILLDCELSQNKTEDCPDLR